MLKKIKYVIAGLLLVGLGMIAFLISSPTQRLKAEEKNQAKIETKDEKETSQEIVKIGRIVEHVDNAAEPGRKDYYSFNDVTLGKDSEKGFGTVIFEMPVGIDVMDDRQDPFDKWEKSGAPDGKSATYQIQYFPPNGEDSVKKLVQFLQTIKFVPKDPLHKGAIGNISVFIGASGPKKLRDLDKEFPQKFLAANKKLDAAVDKNTADMQVDRYIYANKRSGIYYDGSPGTVSYDSDNIHYDAGTDASVGVEEADTAHKAVIDSYKKMMRFRVPKGNELQYKVRLMPNTNYQVKLGDKINSRDSKGDYYVSQDMLSTKYSTADGEVLRDSTTFGKNLLIIKERQKGSGLDLLMFKGSFKSLMGTETTNELYETTLRIRPYVTGVNFRTPVFEIVSNGDWYFEANEPVLEPESLTIDINLSDIVGRTIGDMVKENIIFRDTANNNTPVQTEVWVNASALKDIVLTKENYKNYLGQGLGVKATKWGRSAERNIQINIKADGDVFELPQPVIINQISSRTGKILGKKLYDGGQTGGITFGIGDSFDLSTDTAHQSLEMDDYQLLKNRGSYNKPEEKGQYKITPINLEYYYSQGLDIGKLVEHVDNQATNPKDRDYYQFKDIIFNKDIKSVAQYSLVMPEGIRIQNKEIIPAGWSKTEGPAQEGMEGHVVTLTPPNEKGNPEDLKNFVENVRFEPIDEFHDKAQGDIVSYLKNGTVMEESRSQVADTHQMIVSLSQVYGQKLSDIVKNRPDLFGDKAKTSISRALLSADQVITQENYEEIQSLQVQETKNGENHTTEYSLVIVDDSQRIRLPQPVIIEQIRLKEDKLIKKSLYDGFVSGGITFGINDTDFDLSTPEQRAHLQLDNLSFYKNQGSANGDADKGKYNDSIQVLKYYYGLEVELGALKEHIIRGTTPGEVQDYYAFEKVELPDETKKVINFSIVLPKGIQIQNPEVLPANNTAKEIPEMPTDEKDRSTYAVNCQFDSEQPLTKLQEILNNVRFVPRDSTHEHKNAIGQIQVYLGRDRNATAREMDAEFPQALLKAKKGLDPEPANNVADDRVDRYIAYIPWNGGENDYHYDEPWTGGGSRPAGYESNNILYTYDTRKGWVEADNFYESSDPDYKGYVLKLHLTTSILGTDLSYVQYQLRLMPKTNYTLHLEDREREIKDSGKTYLYGKGTIFHGTYDSENKRKIASLGNDFEPDGNKGKIFAKGEMIKPYEFTTKPADDTPQRLAPLISFSIMPNAKTMGSKFIFETRGNFYVEATPPNLVAPPAQEGEVFEVQLGDVIGMKLSDLVSKEVYFTDKANENTPVQAQLVSPEDKVISKENYKDIKEITLNAEKWGVRGTDTTYKIRIVDSDEDHTFTAPIPQPVIIRQYDTLNNNAKTQFLYDKFDPNGIVFGVNDTSYDLTTTDQRNKLNLPNRSILQDRGSYGQPKEKGQFTTEPIFLDYYYGELSYHVTVHFKDENGQTIAPDKKIPVPVDTETVLQPQSIIGYKPTKALVNGQLIDIPATGIPVKVTSDMEVTFNYQSAQLQNPELSVSKTEVVPGESVTYTMQINSGMTYPEGTLPADYKDLKATITYNKEHIQTITGITIKNSQGEIVGEGTVKDGVVEYTLTKPVKNTENLTVSMTANVQADTPVGTNLKATGTVSAKYEAMGLKEITRSSNDVNTKVTGVLKIVSAPEEFNFGTVFYKAQDIKVTDPTITGPDLQVQDDRSQKNKWELQVKVSKEMTNATSNKVLHNALRYKTKDKDEPLILSQAAQTIYTQQNGGTANISTTWKQDKTGVQLFIDKDQAQWIGQYQGELTWSIFSGGE